MSDKEIRYDNAVVETFFKPIWAELIWRRSREARRQAELAIFEYINGSAIRATVIQHCDGKARRC